jgi:RNA polymerase sigma-70 factor (ECF subfamily)
MRHTSMSPVPDEPGPRSNVRTLPGMRDDTALVEGLGAGEAWARAALFERYATPIERMLRKILGPDQHTEIADVLHDVFVQALASLDRLRDPRAVLSWMQAIAAHTAYRTIRARRARRWLHFWAPATLPEIVAPEIDEEVLDAYRRTYALLDRLPADERVAFALRYIDGMELAQLAVVCDVSLATLKRRLGRAEQRFAAGARGDTILRRWLEEGGRWPT